METKGGLIKLLQYSAQHRARVQGLPCCLTQPQQPTWAAAARVAEGLGLEAAAKARVAAGCTRGRGE